MFAGNQKPTKYPRIIRSLPGETSPQHKKLPDTWNLTSTRCYWMYFWVYPGVGT